MDISEITARISEWKLAFLEDCDKTIHIFFLLSKYSLTVQKIPRTITKKIQSETSQKNRTNWHLSHPKAHGLHYPFPQVCLTKESQNYLGWERTLRSSSQTLNPMLPNPSLNHVPKSHI